MKRVDLPVLARPAIRSFRGLARRQARGPASSRARRVLSSSSWDSLAARPASAIHRRMISESSPACWRLKNPAALSVRDSTRSSKAQAWIASRASCPAANSRTSRSLSPVPPSESSKAEVLSCSQAPPWIESVKASRLHHIEEAGCLPTSTSSSFSRFSSKRVARLVRPSSGSSFPPSPVERAAPAPGP